MRFKHPRATLAAIVAVTLLTWACAPTESEPESMRSIEASEFGAIDGQPVTLFTLTNASGANVGVIEYGGIVVSLNVPDRDGKLGDVVLGFDTLDAYVADTPYFGAITGRYANRIAGGKFEIDGTVYELPVNNGPNSLHGGIKGFDKVVWKGTPTESGDGVSFAYVSQDGEEGFPGTLESTVTYIWTDSNELRIDYESSTDKPTVVNLTNHSYFNLKDGGASSILDHVLMINASNYTPVDATSIPLGEIASLDGSPLDFREATAIGARIEEEDEQLGFGAGYDHNYVIDRGADGLALAATVSEPESGRVMDVLTAEPGVQFYSGNFLDGHHIGKGGVAYQHRSGLCLETQHYPDSPNQPDFPSTVLRPGETYKTSTVYKFYAR
ncbi:MAG: galactose mutarotase [Bryobacterales bacterium]|nr:galactose mutarotase [Bryobacterales bacterium]MDE0264883.1 galactose mutarotase [Bryobacterales bacterium]MDE0621646.1 galactose mutarotase [Bryobacterales bacterium]